MTFSNDVLEATVSGDYNDDLPLANVTIAGLKTAPKSVSITVAGHQLDCNGAHSSFADGVLTVANLQSATANGIWRGDITIMFGQDGSWAGRASGWGRDHWQAGW